MQKLSKIIISIVTIVIFIVIFAVIVGVTSDNGRTPGILGMAALAGLIAALRAIWTKDDYKEDSDNKGILQK